MVTLNNHLEIFADKITSSDESDIIQSIFNCGEHDL